MLNKNKEGVFIPRYGASIIEGAESYCSSDLKLRNKNIIGSSKYACK
ncbi:hypothetical protein [Clostridium sp. JN-1]|jgi:hypothetical protein|nr:hypothetical protein [Clostridium sp. JN-1]